MPNNPPQAFERFDPPPVPPVIDEPWSLGKVRRIVGLFGPAAIIAAMAVGAGETIVAVRVGAWAGYGLLWIVLLSVISKGVCLTYLLGRYTAVTGESLSQRLTRLPGPPGWFLALLTALELAAAPALWTAIARPCGDLLAMLAAPSGADRTLLGQIITTAFVGLALLASLAMSYARLERQQLFVCGVLLAGTLTGVLMVRPDMHAALTGLVAFGHVPEIPSWAPAEVHHNPLPLLAVAFGYVGGTVLTYVVYADLIAERRWGMTGHPQIEDVRCRAAQGSAGDYLPNEPRAVQQLRRSIAPLRWDVAFGAAVLLIVAGSFMMAGAAVIYPRLAVGENVSAFEGWRLLTDQAWVWTTIHPLLVWVYYACILTALWGALQAYPEIYLVGAIRCLRAARPASALTEPQVQKWICAYVFVSATVFIWSGLNFDAMTLIVAFLATNVGVTLAMAAALYLNAQLPPEYRTSWLMFIGSAASMVLLIAVSIICGVEVFNRIGLSQ